MSLINEALKRARVEAAAEQEGPRMDLTAIVAPETRRGGVKVTSLLLATVIVLAVSVVTVLVVGGSATPRVAGAKPLAAGEVSQAAGENSGAVGADGLGKRNDSIAGVEPRDVNEKIGGSGTTIALADVGKDAAAARSVEPVVVPTVVTEVKPVEKVEPKPAIEPVQVATDKPDAKQAASPSAVPASTNQTQQTAEIIAAVVQALEASRAKEIAAKANAVKASEAEASDANASGVDAKQNTPENSHQPSESVKPIATAPRFPTFVGEVKDERFPYLKLSGMSRSNDQQCVLINKQILLLGDTVDNVTVERIERKRVRLKYNGQVFFIELP